MTFRVHVRVTPRPGLLDPQGQAVEHALGSLGFAGVHQVRVGKAIELGIEADSAADAEAVARKMCERLLANPVTEDFAVAVEA
jgi:phosphoribosylformylglycinamidine synthase